MSAPASRAPIPPERSSRAGAAIPSRFHAGPLIAAFAALVIVAAWATVLLWLGEAREKAAADARDTAANYARALEEHAVRTFQAADQQVLFLKFQAESLGRRFELARYLSTGVIQGDIFNLYTIVDEHGEVVQSSRPFTPVNLADREHIRVHIEAETRRLFVGKPVLGRVSGKWSIQMTRRIDAEGGRFGGVVVASLDPFYFTRFYRDFKLGGQGVILLAGLDGIVRARLVGREEMVGQDIGAGEAFALVKSKPEGEAVIRSELDGVERIIAWRRLKDYPVAVVAGLATDEVYAAYRSRRDNALGATAAGTLVVVLFTLIALRLVKAMARSREEAVAASRAKGEFLSYMSHELRTPLAGILGYAELLCEDLEGTEQQAFAEAIDASGRHLLALVNEVLDLARIESGRIELRLAPENLPALLELCVQGHAAAAAAKGLALRTELAPGLPGRFACDRVRLVQVLNNLLHNAVKFTERGQVVLCAVADAEGVRLAVQDTGPGIPVADQARVFDRFAQSSHTGARGHEGTGLGLALASDLVALMGGRLTLDSSPGRGSIFAFHLPLHPPSDSRRPI